MWLGVLVFLRLRQGFLNRFLQVMDGLFLAVSRICLTFAAVYREKDSALWLDYILTERQCIHRAESLGTIKISRRNARLFAEKLCGGIEILSLKLADIGKK